MQPMYIFPIIAVLGFAGANGQSQSSCLVQARFENAKARDGIQDSPFSIRQQQCIERYVQDVRTQLPHYDLSDRRFGGTSAARRPGGAAAKAPILGAGFGTTATRSLAALARQLGLKVHHFFSPGLSKNVLLSVDEMLTRNCSERWKLNDLNFLDLLLSPKKENGEPVDMLLDTPMGELFLDFYAASPESKVVLTLRDPISWATKRREEHGWSSLPLQSPCGPTTDNFTVEVLSELMQHHNSLVRCMVPPDQLLEVNVFDNPDTREIARFLGKEMKFHVPMPYIYFPSKYSRRWNREETRPLHDPHFRKGDRLPIFITGQIRRLELESKIQRLIKPLMEEGHRVEVYLVLDPRHETTYVHRAAGTNVGNYTIAEGNFSELSETAKLFPSKVSVVFDPFIPEDRPVDPRYAMKLTESNPHVQDERPPLEVARERSKSHVRQWEALSRCWKLLHVINGSPTRVALRLRDDLTFLEPFMPRLEDLPEGINVANCENYHGLNDKMAMLVGAGAVRAYFSNPLLFMRHHFNTILSVQNTRTQKPMNPESVMLDVMTVSNITSHFAAIPAYRRTLLRDAEDKVHVCYAKGSSSPHSCFWKILPGVRDHTKAVFASREDEEQDQAAFYCELD